ncbi:DUF4865 family protein [Dactylosporangium matsuzakiense]|uniref:DUF4865 domain-containing protein n=2 Tax=Dactylosporangium matsuzakiense TaxID=53360 RepID=A0A9W6KSI1_9ACTN|nr:DUF4865 domain-containing protein [Dactylosporangium matsuzakiense]
MYGMDAMQYSLPLPTDYDMGTIRERVRRNGHALDDREGLGFKAYLIRTAGVDGSPVNEYAPFYVWNSAPAMTQFLLGGGGFQHIVRDFGRPAVQHWTVVSAVQGPARDQPPLSATRTVTPLEWGAELPAPTVGADLHTAVVAYDPSRWELLRFELWSAAHRGPYEVLHLSAPSSEGF